MLGFARWGFVALFLCGPLIRPLHADDVARRVKKAVAESTLDQPGTKPFHLKATLAPSRQRDNDSGRTGTVEIWWKSPTEWRREVSCPVFHQVQIVQGDQIWQKNDGDYFPDWLRQTAVELIDPVPNLRDVLVQMDTGEVKDMFGSTYVEWMIPSTDGKVTASMGATVALTDSTGLLFYGGGFGWGAIFHNYRKFNGRMVPTTVGVGDPEVTATVTTLENLQETPGLFDVSASGSDPHPIRTVFLDELALRKNLDPMPPVQWPAVKDGPLEGAATTEVVVDRQGRVREVSTTVTQNNAVADAAREYIESMHFRPFLLNGEPVQVVSRVTLGFTTTRASLAQGQPPHSE